MCAAVVLILANVTATLMAMAIGAAAPSNSVANMAGSLAIMLFLLFGGFMLNKDQARRLRMVAVCRGAAAKLFAAYSPRDCALVVETISSVSCKSFVLSSLHAVRLQQSPSPLPFTRA